MAAFVLAPALTIAVVANRSDASTTKAACESVLVSVDWDHDRAEKVSGVVVRVGYPSTLEIPVTDGRESSQDRVQLLTGTSGGLFDAVPRDSNGDGRRDVLSVGLITHGIGSGPFARIRFDCAPGAARAKASDFSCVSDIADEAGSVPSSCRVAVAAD